MNNSGLVLEGGGMRGVFSGGILEYFLENHIQFPYVVAVSAGACNAASYISKQQGRNKAVTVEYAGHKDYISYKRLFRYGELFNMDFIFNKIPNIENPFDYETFFQSNQKFFIGTTDCRTGETYYYEKNQIKEDLNKILRASSSLPLVSSIVEHDGKALLDGGISAPIPIDKSISDGNEKHVVILTQCLGYKKEPMKRGKWLLKRKYQEYSGLMDVLERRANKYNELLNKVQMLEEQGRAFVFRPDSLMGVGRTEQKKERLQALYDHGYEQARRRMEDLLKFIETPIKQNDDNSLRR